MSTRSPGTNAPWGREVGTAKARSPRGTSDATGPARTRASRFSVTTSPGESPARRTRPAALEMSWMEPGGTYRSGRRATRSWDGETAAPRSIRSPATTTFTAGPAGGADAAARLRYPWSSTTEATARTADAAKYGREDLGRRFRTQAPGGKIAFSLGMRSGEEAS